MKRTIAVCILGLLLLTCSKKSTNPPENNPPVRTPFTISYTADPARTASAHIAAAVGGSLTALDKDSVAFELTIPPYALPSDTTISITPFSFLRIGGPGGDTCPTCTDSGSLCCYRGAVFEPSGLVLDSPAVLTVRLPKHFGFPYPHGALIVYLDSASKSYQSCFTTYDTAAGWLRAEITHFSGYGTDDERYDRFEEEIYQAGEKLSSDVGTWAFYIDLYPLKQLRFTCDGCDHPDLPLNACYPDLITAIEKIVLDAYTRHAALIRGKAVLQEPCDALVNLYMCFGNIDALFEVWGPWSNFDDFGPIKNDLRNDYVALVYKTGNEGHRLCEADSCDAGMELLACAHDAIRLSNHSGIDFDDEFCASINNWMINCQCGFDVSIFSDKDVVHKIAVSEGDAENCIVRYSAGVHNNVTNEPVESAHVQFYELTGPVGTHFIGSGDTDSTGRCEIIYEGSDFAVECGDNTIHRVFAEVVHSSKVYYSDTVSVAVRGLRIAVSVDFQAHHKVTGDENNPGYLEEATGSIIGTITGPGNASGFDSSCWDGGFSIVWTREYENPFIKVSSVGRLLNPKTAFYPVAGYTTDSTVIVPGTSVSVKLLTTISAHLNFLATYYAVERSGTTDGRTYCDTTSECIFGGGYWNWYVLGFATPPVFQVTDGSCEPFHWTRDTLGTTSSQTVIVDPIF
ncbi:MAG: hypothetical protein NT002_00195 [candidate division Zixibacteria bacterium]|nr:hypothetical protein [candidate division Zixibacteria bacterium]